jgi:hypothetical protein
VVSTTALMVASMLGSRRETETPKVVSIRNPTHLEMKKVQQAGELLKWMTDRKFAFCVFDVNDSKENVRG